MSARSSCAVDSALKVIGDRWTLVIIHELSLRPRRTVELHRAFQGLSTKTLLARLKKLQRAGLVSRRSFRESPPRVEYALTVRGNALMPLVREVAKSVLLWDELAGQAQECNACAALKEDIRTTVMEGAENRDNLSSRRSEPGPGRSQIRKRRDVTLL